MYKFAYALNSQIINGADRNLVNIYTLSKAMIDAFSTPLWQNLSTTPTYQSIL